VLTSVGYDHTEWLGETLEEIAAEKVAVLRDHTTLVRGDLPEEVEPVIEAAVSQRRADQIRPAGLVGGGAPPGDTYFPSIRGYQQLNMALAWKAASQVATEMANEDEVKVILRSMSGVRIPGRAEVMRGDPPTIFDAAHNPDGAKALARLLPELSENRDVVCCLAILEGKDAPGIVNALAPAVAQFVCAEIPPERIEGSGRPGGRARPALEVAALCQKAGVEAEAIPDPLAAWDRARELARKRDGVALAAGSHYLLSSIWIERPAQSS
jgi:dihydrofolate synthase / folylpolyglutamate synthase